jgi:elongation factor P
MLIDKREACMVTASQLRAGMAIRFEGAVYKVLAAEYHPGQGKMGGSTHARLKNLSSGTLWEHSFRSELKLEDLPVEKQPMDFLYTDADACYFMNPESFEQVPVPAAVVGPQARFLQPEMRVAVEFVEEQPVSVLFPDVVEVRIADTAPPVHAQQDSTWKSARLENGAEIMVPQFLKTGDAIRLDLANLKYMDRAKGSMK